MRVFYGGKSAGVDHWCHVRKAMEAMNFQSCKADPDAWFRLSQKSNGALCYQLALLCAGDSLVTMEDPEKLLRN